MQKNVETMQGGAAYLNDMLNMSDPPEASDCKSEIPKFFAGCNILITGGSGFLGILLIEKLLRCCPDISKMYLLLRGKKNKSPEERFTEYFDDVIFEKLKKEQPNFINKVIMVEADLGKLDLGLSPENRKHLLDTNVVFHGAATVRFNEAIRVAVNINVRGTKQLLLFAKEMPNLKAFVHTSTAFSYCVHKCIEEKYYTPPLETEKILTLLEVLDDKTLDKMMPILLGEWPNTYAFSKAIAEDAVRQYSIGIPVCIVRPAIVTSTSDDPIPGWINNVYGAVGVVMGGALGLIRTIHCVPENNAEIVPADYVISQIIVAAWDIAKRKNTLLSIENANSDVPEIERAPIYNYVSSRRNPITWKKFMKYNEISGMKVPSTHVLWYYMLFLNRYLFIHNICVILLHTLPGAITDVILFLSGRKPMLLNTYKKVNKFSSVLSYFSSQQWEFGDKAVEKLWNRVNPADRQIFNFNIEDLNWKKYNEHLIPGMRTYIIKDSWDTLAQGQAKYKKLKIAHYSLMTSIMILFIWGFVRLISFFMDFVTC